MPRDDQGLPHLPHGVLPSQHLERALAEGWLHAEGDAIPAGNIQPASVDLRLDEVAFPLRCSFLPDTELSIEQKIERFSLGRLDLGGGQVLEVGRPYLVPLKERLVLPANVRGKANPKSSTGRLDVFTRVLTEDNYRFDDVPAGYRGRLYLEVVPRSFPIRVEPGLSLNQLRLVVGDARCTDREIRELHERSPVLFAAGQPVAPDGLAIADGLFLRIDLRPNNEGSVGYQARRNRGVIDLSKVAAYDAEDFWTRVTPERGAGGIILEPEEFYLLLSSETVSIPPTVAAEMTAYDPTAGELRTHYAGFFDPGFGYDPSGRRRGTAAVLEVRAHDVPFLVEHDQRVCKLSFERMSAEPDLLYGHEIGSSYQDQNLTLSKHFRAHGSTEVPQLQLVSRGETPGRA